MLNDARMLVLAKVHSTYTATFIISVFCKKPINLLCRGLVESCLSFKQLIIGFMGSKPDTAVGRKDKNDVRRPVKSQSKNKKNLNFTGDRVTKPK